ncbi:MAG: hypothetical protein KKB81_03750 [Candidatus Margulisbacteria bacterium]|nr:hypothetical protein [Candidatus Margulisiibacteriota bacterium]MBU1021681.1 hypothetical protein [Candidatus Margulisiibacteriota bacterium]MBU1729559.1 hypothetical protein [Candidatus Margulisiibacteriota bacterium]MBU1955045.1 hypothetical protein [Candidatus Margulisiibacteriota bacterium]
MHKGKNAKSVSKRNPFQKKLLKVTVPLVFVASFSLLVFSLLYSQPESVGIAEVLSTQGSPQLSAFNSFSKFMAIVFGLSLVALTFEGYKSVRHNFKNPLRGKAFPKASEFKGIKSIAVVSSEEEYDKIKQLSAELEKKNNLLLEEKTLLERDVRRFGEAVNKMNSSEELMRKSNESLRKGYEKLVKEKEALLAALDKKEWELNELASAANKKSNQLEKPVKNLVSPGEYKKRRAIEKLASEVDQMLVSKKEPKKTKVKKNKMTMKKKSNKRVKKK